MNKFRAMQVPAAGAAFQMIEKAVPRPGRNEVLIRVEACGVCHSDSIAKDGLFPGIRYPITPGHEVVGVIDEVGEDVIGWNVGTRVGVGWFGGNCGHCEPCRRGDLISCQNLRVPGVNFDGGYAEAMLAPASALVRMPEEIDSVNAAPI
jgi:D-arabinose 1-dehydrogenase-like Zn-dependent alcohol dehydrogenase